MRSYLNINVMSSCVLCLVVLLISPLKHEKNEAGMEVFKFLLVFSDNSFGLL